ncbi:MAG: right-handed parallel beta-helix repeat-containing protein [Campylobacterota bacterium]|nr:right-handed parallel beta-helix repeat-containing protein [Campylobacterota bacterium]
MKYFIILLVALLGTGCVYSDKKNVIVSSLPDFSTDNKTVNYKGDIPNSVAILPFYAKNKEASLIVTNSFYSNFSKLPYNDVELSTIRDIHKEDFNITTPKSKLNKVCEEIGVDGLVYGDVQNFDKLYLGFYSEVSVGAKINFYNCNNNTNIWSFEDTAKKRQGGISTTPWGIVMTAIVSAYNLKKVQVYRASEDLFRDIVKSIPHAKYNIKDTVDQPTFIYHSGMKKEQFGIGETIDIKVAAAKNLKIIARITGIKDSVVLKETTDGIYIGKYKVKPHNNTNGYLQLKIISNTASGQFYDYISKINIDTTAPKKADITVVYSDKIYIKVNSDEEISLYQLEKLENNKFIPFKSSNKNEFILPVTNETLTLRALLKDKANNISVPSEALKVFLYSDNKIAKSNIYANDNVISSIVRINKNITLDKLYIAKDGYLILMPNTKVSIKILKNDGVLNIINSELNTKSLIVNGDIKISNSQINSSGYGIDLKNSSDATINDSVIKSKYTAIKMIDASRADIKNTKLLSNDVFSDIMISGNAKAKIQNCEFSTTNIADVVSNSSNKSTLIGNGIVQGPIDVKK